MRYMECAACAVNSSDTRLTTASRTSSIGAFTPNPHRADREVDGEAGADADQVRQEVEQAEPGQHLDDADVEHERAERDQVEAREPAAGQAHRAEGPQLVQHVV